MDLRFLNKYALLAIAGILVVIGGVFITINQLQKQQETRSRAAGEAVSVILAPLSRNVNVGDDLLVQVNINGGQNNVSAVDIAFTYDKDLLGEPIGECPPPPPEVTNYQCGTGPFAPSSTFTTVINNSSSPGTVHYVGVNPTANTITGSSINLGTLHFTANAQGTATIGFSNIHINASGVAGALPVDTKNTKPGTYTIGDSGCLGGPVGCPTVIPTTKCTPKPSDCDEIVGPNVLPECVEPAGGWCPATPTPTTAPTGTGGQTTIELSLQVTGVGTNSSQGLNNNPKNSQRNVEVGAFNAQNQNILSTDGTVNYDATNGLYRGSVIVNLTTGAYIVKVRLGNTLWRQIPGIQNIAAATSNQTPTAILVSGDLNRDNEINLLDYTLMISCLQNRSTCNNSLSMEDVKGFIAFMNAARLRGEI